MTQEVVTTVYHPVEDQPVSEMGGAHVFGHDVAWSRFCTICNPPEGLRA